MNATPQSLIVPSDENPRMSTARQLIAKNIGQGLSTLERGQSAVELASVILSEANRIQTSEEKVIQARFNMAGCFI